MADDQGIRANVALLDQGWTRRYIADENRAKEAVETYSQAGFEVLLDPLAPSLFGTGCQDCAQSVCGSYVMVYTRKLEAT